MYMYSYKCVASTVNFKETVFDGIKLHKCKLCNSQHQLVYKDVIVTITYRINNIMYNLYYD